MDYQDALIKLERLRELWHKAYMVGGSSAEARLLDEICMLYGALEDTISRFAGVDNVVVPVIHGGDSNYPNYIAARILSSRTLYQHEGYTQLLKVIGKVRQYADDPTIPQVQHSVTSLAQVLRRFRECCQYLDKPPQAEKDVQMILWIILRSHFERLEKEETLPRFGAKGYRPDFGIPDLRALVEVKFIGPKTTVSSIQESILSDVPGYVGAATAYDSIIAFMYDAANQLMDSRRFVEDLKSVDGIVDVIVVPAVE